VRDFQQLKADPRATPTAAREFSRAERVFVRVITYGSTVAPSVTAKLLNRTGQAIADLPVAPAAAAPGAHDVDLALASLAPGEYLVELTLGGGGDPVKQLVGFRVTG
jgi:hypothetical protein